MPIEFGPVVPTLFVASMRVSLDFYTTRLGFTIKWSWGDEGGFQATSEPEFACIECGEAVLFLSDHSGGSKANLFVELPFAEDVDALASALDGVAPIDEALETTPWGSREFSARDPDGHVLRFSCPSDRVRTPPRSND